MCSLIQLEPLALSQRCPYQGTLFPDIPPKLSLGQWDKMIWQDNLDLKQPPYLSKVHTINGEGHKTDCTAKRMMGTGVITFLCNDIHFFFFLLYNSTKWPVRSCLTCNTSSHWCNSICVSSQADSIVQGSLKFVFSLKWKVRIRKGI